MTNQTARSVLYSKRMNELPSQHHSVAMELAFSPMTMVVAALFASGCVSASIWLLLQRL